MLLFNLSDEKLYIERVTYTLVDALAKTGGMMGIILGMFQIMMFVIEDVLMYSDFIAKLYKTQSLSAVKKSPQL